MSQQKLYVITREDLKPGYQAVQAVHAAIDFIFKYPDISRNWHDISNYLVILSVPTESELKRTAQTLTAANLLFSPFHEPDIDNQLTAIAIEPSEKAQRFCSGYKLALKDK